ncbi:MAG: SusC/RagA family TonB-linked outer membrane protein [Tannerellaceae bacterium]|jgi:TonB-linked SusC/RagA family outer membrane protein|nr:SusC/RagA family TonB-linked outer membrane protein [Tannerellaceae bacterium]
MIINKKKEHFILIIMQKIKYYMICVCCLLAGAGINAQTDSLQTIPAEANGDRVSLGYFSQPATSITGAVETVSGKTLEKTPAANLGLSFAGRFTGLNTIESFSELSNATVLKFIRGISTVNGTDPLVIIDGVIGPTDNWDYLTPHEIERISILKDGASTAIYGMQGAGGAIIITTKRGAIGKTDIEAYFDQSLQQITRKPRFVSSAEYVALRNQAGINDGLGAYSQFSQSAVNGFNENNNPLYPNNDWYSMFVKEFALMQRAGVNISGGSEKIRYFSNLNYTHQNSPLKVEDEPNRKYDPTPAIHSINFRSNIDVKLNNYLTGFLRLSGNVDYEQTAQQINSHLYSHVFYLPPTMYGPLTPPDAENPELGNQVVTTDQESFPVYGLLNRGGYNRWFQTSIMSQAGLTMNLDFLTNGLSLSGLMAYQTHSTSLTSTHQNFERRIRSDKYDVLEFSQKGTDENTPLTYAKMSQFSYNLNLFAHLDYNRTFDNHSISAMAYMLYLSQEKEFLENTVSTSTIGSEILPYKRHNMAVSVQYGFKNRYFLKGDLGYTGSEQFAPGYRYITTPAISAAWIASDEDFLIGNELLTYLKLRASYGINANDQLGDDRFMYLDYYDSEGTEGLKGNPFLTAEKIKKQNYGVDFSLFHDLRFQLDYFIHRTDNMLISSEGITPIYQGIQLSNYPKLNNGVMKNSGLEASVMYQKQINKDWGVFAGAGIHRNKNEVINANEMKRGEGYKYQHFIEGFSVGQNWGYLIDKSNGNGYINTAEELADATRMYNMTGTGKPRLGDFLFQDISRDGKIDDKDLAPIGYSRIPEIYYNSNLGFTYKGFELSALFQGTARSSAVIDSPGVVENMYEGYFSDIHMNAWTPERYANGETISFPALSLSTSTSHSYNEFFIMNTSYLRLRNLEVAYTLPATVSKLVAAKNIRIALNAQNLFTIDHMKTKYIDPETARMNLFQPYRVYNIGISMIF